MIGHHQKKEATVALSEHSMPRRRLLGAALWTLAFVLMVAIGGYQRRTGPTYAYRGSASIQGSEYSYSLVRKGDSREGARLEIPDPGPGFSGEVLWRRYPTRQDFRSVPLRREDGKLWAALPAQPAAGKIEYRVHLSGAGEELYLPGKAGVAGAQPGSPGSASADSSSVAALKPDTVIMRCKNHVPLALLLPHILVMFFSMMVGLRAALGALFLPRRLGSLVAWTMAGLTLGGMILGPCVQKVAFGAFWTGWPKGYDLTDNKTLIMWLVWLLVVVLFRRWPRRQAWQRVVVVVATAVMLTMYLIPHSLRGSELDYQQLDRGVEAHEAVETG